MGHGLHQNKHRCQVAERIRQNVHLVRVGGQAMYEGKIGEKHQKADPDAE